MTVPALTGPEAVHNDALTAALAAIDELVQQEKAEAEPSEDDLAPLVGARVLLEQWATHEAGEYSDGADDVGADDGYAMSVSGWTEKGDTATLLRKSVAAAEAISSNERQGIVKAAVNTTNLPDMQRDFVQVGAWRRVCEAGQKPKILISHDHNSIPVGVCTQLEELAPGDARLPRFHRERGAGALIATMRLNMESERGREAFSAIKMGAVSEYSVGFTPLKSAMQYDAKADLNRILDIETLVEVSCVVMGASPGTQTLLAKAALSTYAPGDPRRSIAPNEVLALPQEIVEALIVASNADVPRWIKDLLTVDEIEFVREAVRGGLAELAKESLATILVEAELNRRLPERGKKSAWLSEVAAWRAKSARQPRRDLADVSGAVPAYGAGPDFEYLAKSFTLIDAEPVLDVSVEPHQLSAPELAAIEEDAERRRRRQPAESTETPSPDFFQRYPRLKPTPADELTT